MSVGWRLVGSVGSTVAGAALAVALAPAVSAGGWAMSSLDPMSVPVAGERTEVGFTIRQHGVTPVNPDDDGIDPVEIAVWSASGEEAVFPARQEGPTGHYVATVVFPEAGQAHWQIHQGWFGSYDLGAIAVAEPSGGVGAAPAAPTTGAAEHRWPLAARAAAVAVAVAATGVAVAETWRGRRARRGRGVPPSAVDPIGL